MPRASATRASCGLRPGTRRTVQDRRRARRLDPQNRVQESCMGVAKERLSQAGDRAHTESSARRLVRSATPCIETEAWVLHEGADGKDTSLQRERLLIRPPERGEVLVEPLYGCWEGNMGHAVARRPVDLCRDRREDTVVIGNAGVVRVVDTGPDVTAARE